MSSLIPHTGTHVPPEYTTHLVSHAFALVDCHTKTAPSVQSRGDKRVSSSADIWLCGLTYPPPILVATEQHAVKRALTRHWRPSLLHNENSHSQSAVAEPWSHPPSKRQTTQPTIPPQSRPTAINERPGMNGPSVETLAIASVVADAQEAIRGFLIGRSVCHSHALRATFAKILI